MARILGKIIEEDHGTLTITEIILGEKITEVKIIKTEVEVETIVEIHTETITEMTIDDKIILVETEAG